MIFSLEILKYWYFHKGMLILVKVIEDTLHTPKILLKEKDDKLIRMYDVHNEVFYHIFSHKKNTVLFLKICL